MIKVNGVVVTPTNFPDGTKLIKYADDIAYTTDITWYYESDEELFTLYALTKHLQNFDANCFLYMPYVPNARMDRTKSIEEVFTLKYFADFINSLNYKQVTILDPHSTVSEALFDRCFIKKPYYAIVEAVQKSNPDVIFFPDEGAMKRYDWVAVNKPRVFGIKNRNWETGEIKGLSIHGDVDALDRAKVLIIDDICSKGGTFYHSAKALKEAGAATIDLYVTHCEHTIFEGELLKSDLINRIYTTNSIFRKEHEKIEVFEV